MEMIAYITKNNQLYYAPANEPQENERATEEQIKQANLVIEYVSEYNKLLDWFSFTYNKYDEKYRRLNTLYNVGLLTTDEAKNAYSNLIALYNEAEDKRKRIQELEALINVKN